MGAPTPANNRINIFDIGNDLDHRIKNIVIHNIPLSKSKSMSALKTIGKIMTPLIHSALTPTLSHIIIQLNLEDCNFFYLIEYGQYISNISNESLINNHSRYYINEDGARITRISNDELIDRSNDSKEKIISKIIVKESYGEAEVENYEKISKNFHRVECDIKNKITLRELIDKFKNESWSAKKYNVLIHNSQIFGAEIVKILKAVRMHESDKIRTNEKLLLPNCIIKALWKNEDLSLTNTLGRIPIFGLFHDLVKNNMSDK